MRLPEFLRLRLRAWAHKKTQTPPDFIIRPQGRDQTLRWWVIPRNRFFNIYLHKFVLSDEDRALHDHPWANCSILIDGQYIEHTPKGCFLRHQGFMYFRPANSPHRVELRVSLLGERGIRIVAPLSLNHTDFDCPEPIPVTTIFITGPKIREWGFLCPKGWRHWKDFCDTRDHGVIGKGCE